MSVSLVALVGLAGCGEDTKAAPPFPKGSGQPESDAVPYPEGPYGIKKDATIANYEFVGFADASKVSNAMQPIQLADFYNPTGMDVFPKDSLYGAGEPKPKALLIDVASVWCGPCNQEAATILPGKYATYKPKGGQFLLQLADSATPGDPATSDDLHKWTLKYKVNYPSAIDPTYKLGALFDADAFPANMIIRTKDMKIMEVVAGEPDDAFWADFQKVLDGQDLP